VTDSSPEFERDLRDKKFVAARLKTVRLRSVHPEFTILTVMNWIWCKKKTKGGMSGEQMDD
jgi:hypothetical protein